MCCVGCGILRFVFVGVVCRFGVDCFWFVCWVCVGVFGGWCVVGGGGVVWV